MQEELVDVAGGDPQNTRTCERPCAAVLQRPHGGSHSPPENQLASSEFLRAAPGGADRSLLHQVVLFSLFGALGMATTAVLYLLLLAQTSPLVANLIAQITTALCNTELNRRFTFPRPSGATTGRIHVQGLVVFGLFYVITSGALLTLHARIPDPTWLQETTVLVAASAVGTAIRFALLRFWVFQPHDAR